MARVFLLLLFGCICIGPVSSQHYYYNYRFYDPVWLVEGGISLGAINCLTDLGGRSGKGRGFLKDLNLSQSHLCAGLYFQGLYNYVWALRASILAGRISASDQSIKKDNSDASARYLRNLHFRSPLFEISAMGQWHFVSHYNQRKLNNAPLFSPYLTTGVGIYRFSPKAKLENKWVTLHPLRTEGQGFAEYAARKPYRLSQLCLPIGMGIRYELAALINLQLEVTHRLLFTDYLDDVSNNYPRPELFATYLPARHADIAKKLSDRRKELDPSLVTAENQQRGNPSRNDSYFTVHLSLGYVFNRKRR